jgi:hypothetical protein
MDPQHEQDDNLAVMKGQFQQIFYLKSNCSGFPAISEKLVSIECSTEL